MAKLPTAVGIAAPVLTLELLATAALVTVEFVCMTLVVVVTETLVLIPSKSVVSLVALASPELIVGATKTPVWLGNPVVLVEDGSPLVVVLLAPSAEEE